MKAKMSFEIKPREWLTIIAGIIVFILLVNKDYKQAVDLIKVLMKGK